VRSGGKRGLQMSEDTALVQLQFEGYQIRRIMDEETGEWWYAVVDVIQALTDSTKPRDYWYDLKRREQAKSGVELSEICREFKLKAANNRVYNTDCANVEGMLRIIQSIPSPKAEPFKRWLAEGEAATTEITRQDDAQGFQENQTAARKGGRIAGNVEGNWRRKQVAPLFRPPITW